MIECRNISKGKAEGELIVSSEAISFLGGVDPETGVVIDPNHELKGESIKDKVLFIPSRRERLYCRVLCYISDDEKQHSA